MIKTNLSIFDIDAFKVEYQRAVHDVLQFFTPERLLLMARHNPGWRPDRFDAEKYLVASETRYANALQLYRESAESVLDNAAAPRVLDVGGFMGAFPLALSRMGCHVVLAEKYGYYYGAFDDLRKFLESSGIEVWDQDFTMELDTSHVAESFDLVTNMAMLEHLAHSPKKLMENIFLHVAPKGFLIVEVPNIAYWPNRVKALRGMSVLPALRDVYEAADPFTGHHREYTSKDLCDLLNWSGLKVEGVKMFNYSASVSETWKQLLILSWPTKLFPNCREVIMACASRQKQS